MKTAVFAGFVLVAGVFAGAHFSQVLRGTDFPEFYCAARMLGEGNGRQLYDGAVQRRYQATYAGRIGTLFTHPPFEAVVYGVVAWLPLSQAYILWFLLNLGFLGLAMRSLARDARGPQGDWRLLFAASLMFVPILLCLQQAQDSLLLLWLTILAWQSLRRDRGFAAGCWLALGLFKFQVVLPLALVLVFATEEKRRRQFAKGFASAGIALVAISAVLCGWRVFIEYPTFLIRFRMQPYGGIHPEGMANFRGVASLVFGQGDPAWPVIVVCGLSVAAFLWVVWTSRRAIAGVAAEMTPARGFDSVFSRAVLFALLVSYHLNPHDLSPALLPVLLMLPLPWVSTRKNWLLAIVMAAFFLPPLHVWGLRTGLYCLISIPATGLLLLGFSRDNASNSASI